MKGHLVWDEERKVGIVTADHDVAILAATGVRATAANRSTSNNAEWAAFDFWHEGGARSLAVIEIELPSVISW